MEETIWRRKALMNGISVFVKETPGSPLDPSTMRGYSEKWHKEKWDKLRDLH